MSDAPDNLTALQKVAAAQTAPVVAFNTELVRSAWSALQQRRRDARRAELQTLAVSEDVPSLAADPLASAWIEQLWTDHVIVRVDNGDGDFLRIPYTVNAPGTSSDNIQFGQPERVRVAYVAASARQRSEALAEVLELSKRVRTMAGARRYRKPIGSQFGDTAPGGAALATVAKAASSRGSGATQDQLRDSIQSVAREKTYRGGKVFGDIGNEGKLKSALGQISRLPDGRRGAAAAEVVKAAQALGLTSLVPVQVKRIYRQYIAQSPINEPGKAPTVRNT